MALYANLNLMRVIINWIQKLTILINKGEGLIIVYVYFVTVQFDYIWIKLKKIPFLDIEKDLIESGHPS